MGNEMTTAGLVVTRTRTVADELQDYEEFLEVVGKVLPDRTVVDLRIGVWSGKWYGFAVTPAERKLAIQAVLNQHDLDTKVAQ